MDKKMIKPEYSGLEIAVIGMAGRFPGAGNIDDFWENLKNGVESVKFFSDAELVEAGLDRETIDNPNFIKAYGDLDGREYFDSSFFGYVPEEALVMDPQMRLFHECVWEALEDAGYPPDTYDGLIGLYGGAGPGFCWEIYAAAFASHAIDSFSANQLRNRDYLCARISYKLNLKGPAVFVQTACSTGLVAVHLASRGLLTGETHIALAGGVALKINSFPGYIYQEGMIYTRDGHTRAFDAKANGVMGGEGAGVVVLKLLKHAMADQDHIWAIIKGTAINNDGLRKVGFTAPSPDGQAEVIRMALKMSRVDPQTIGYIETHGTATPLGDIIEMEALNLVFGKGKEKRCPIGSVKTNIGHTDAAAGSASLIKTVLALKYRQIPPSLHFQTPNPNIDFSSFYVNTALQDWISDGDHPRRAGVSSFGIGGTNAHVILEEFQGLFLKKPPLDPAKTFDFGLMIFSAKSQAALDRMIGNYYDFFEKNKEIAIEDAAYTLQLGRSSFPHRAFFVCKDADDAREILSAPASGKIKRFSIPKKGKPPVFMFSGQGTYYINMGLELYQSQDPCVAVFRRELDRCFELIKSENDFKAILFPEKGKEEPEALNRTSISQPLLFMFEYALASMLIAWGIKPGAMIGYSTGEYTAACLAGVFSLENALKLVALRGRLVEALPVGAMLSVPLTENELLPILKSHEELSLAVDNGSSCVVSGTPEDISAFEKEMKAQKRLCIRLNVTHAGHSRILEPIVEIYEAAVREVKPQKPSERYVSTVTGQWITDAQATDPGYWAQHIQSPVRFFQGLNVLMGEDYSTFIEIGPGKSLSNFARQHPGKKEGMLIANLVRDMNETVSDMYYLMDRLGRMWLYGQSIDWKKFYGEKKKHRMSLPTYPFEKIRYPSTVNISKIVSDLTAVMGDKFGKNEAYGNAVFSEASYKAERPELVTPYVEPSTLTEKELVLMWENFFGVGKIGIIDDFFELGGDSLKAMTLSGKIHRQFDVEIQLTDFFGHPTIKDLATLIDSSTKNEFRSIPKAPKKDHYLLSAAQKRLFFIQHMAPEGTAYNLPQVLMLPDAPDNDQLERIFNTLIERHESFRTSFELTEEGPVQRIHDPEQVPFSIHYPDYPINPKDLNTELLKFVVPFDLSAAPLLRAAVIKTTENTWMLFTDMHHIISDGVSMTRLETEFTDLVAGRTLPPLPIQYRDFSEWQNSEEQQQKTTDKAQYWLNQFGDSVPTLELPYDFPRPPVTSFEGNTTRFGLEKEIVDRLKEIGAPSDATLYMVLMAIYFVFLSKLSGQDDIVVGIPVAGRNHPDLQPIIGMFVNTLAIRNYPVAEQTFLNFLEEVKASALGAYENQDYPFEELVEKLNLDRNTARNPVFDVVFNMLNQAEFKGELPSFNQEYVHTPGISKYDLNMYFVEIEGGRGLIFNVEYGSKLFKPETINRFIGYFKYIVSQVLMQPDIELKAIDILGEDERHQIVSEFSQSGETFAIDNTLHGLFDEQVVRTPDNIALIGNFYQGAFLKNRPLDPQKTFCFLTYHRLNEQSEHLACVLRDKGVNSNVIVGIQIERSIEMIIGILGILKAGGAYLPIDTDYPQERIDYMLKDSGVQVFITEREFEAFRRGAPACAPGSNSEIITIGQTRGSAPTENLPEEASYLLNAFPLPATGHRLPVTSLAYVIYTSGSTGRPKGVMVEHRSISNTIYWRMNEYKMKPNDRALQLFSFAFDGFITSFFTPVVSGAAVIQLSAEDVKDTGRIKEVIARMGITHLIAVPSLYRMILETGTEKELSGLKIITLAGEQVQTDIIEKSRTMNPSLEIVNEYGPTEGSVVVSYYRNLNRGGGISIGKPIANMSIIIIDRQMNLVPVGIAGEIALKGKGLARGYLNNPELTAERFLSVDSVSSVANKFYKTGDMGKWSEDGNIQFLGRMDQQVKIRGFRIELGEIENRLLTYKDIKEAVVLCGEEHGDKYLCAYIVSDSEYDVAELRNYLSGQLPQVMVPSYFVKMDRIPLTSNGKINRSALPKPVLTGGASYVAPGDDVEKTLIEIWGTVLNTQTPIGIDDNFFHLGGHSLKAAILAGRIRRQFQIDFSLLELFKTPTVREIASLIKFILWAKEKPADITETENHIQQEEDNEEIFI